MLEATRECVEGLSALYEAIHKLAPEKRFYAPALAKIRVPSQISTETRSLATEVLMLLFNQHHS